VADVTRRGNGTTADDADHADREVVVAGVSPAKSRNSCGRHGRLYRARRVRMQLYV